MPSLYTIKYINMDPVSFNSQTELSAYLKKERDAWSSVLRELLESVDGGFSLQSGNHVWVSEIPKVFNTLVSREADPKGFNSLTNVKDMKLLVPPPSNSMEAILIFELWESGRLEDARAFLLGVMGPAPAANDDSELSRLFRSGQSQHRALRIALSVFARRLISAPEVEEKVFEDFFDKQFKAKREEIFE